MISLKIVLLLLFCNWSFYDIRIDGDAIVGKEKHARMFIIRSVQYKIIVITKAIN